jgi:hypothetical protein
VEQELAQVLAGIASASLLTWQAGRGYPSPQVKSRILFLGKSLIKARFFLTRGEERSIKVGNSGK